MHLSVIVRSVLLAGFLVLDSASRAADPEKPNAAASEDVEAAYTRSITGRTDKILEALTLTNAVTAGEVHAVILKHWRDLRDWHSANDATTKSLTAKIRSTNAAEASAAKASLDETNASLKALHDGFIERLSARLDPTKVEVVKDQMTYNVVKVTTDAYHKMLPDLTADQKAKIVEWLKEAREEAMDQGSSKEKHAVFGRYKGRINNYLSKEGYDLGKASKELEAELRKKKTGAN